MIILLLKIVLCLKNFKKYIPNLDIIVSFPFSCRLGQQKLIQWTYISKISYKIPILWLDDISFEIVIQLISLFEK